MNEIALLCGIVALIYLMVGYFIARYIMEAEGGDRALVAVG